MDTTSEGAEFLKEKYDLHKTPEVDSAARWTKVHTEEKVAQDPSSRINNYLDRLEGLTLDPDKPRALTLLRGMVMEQYIRPHKAKVAAGAVAVEERAARQLGINAQYQPEQVEQRGEIAIKDLEGSLDQWITYLSDPHEPYPSWFRYYTFRNIIGLGRYDKDKGEFPKRSAGTGLLFPDIDSGALAHILDIMNASKDPAVLEQFRENQIKAGTPEEQLLTQEKAAAFAKLSFAKQYADAINQAGEITPEMREETRGEWVTYKQGSDPIPLWASLQNKGTSWCTAGHATATTQLEGGDFHVYYTLDKQGKPAIPRIAIRMQNGKIFEARGVADSNQNLEANMTDIASVKIDELPGAEKYHKATADMKLLTSIEQRIKEEQPLTRDELTFLYEIDTSIEGFGRDKDPRIRELIQIRNLENDIPIIFGCTADQVVWEKEKISEDTKVYIGPLFPGVFKNLRHVDYIYTSFPDDRVDPNKLRVGVKSQQEILAILKRGGVQTSYHSTDQSISQDAKEPKDISIVKLKIWDLLGLEPSYATAREILDRATSLGLELCSPEAALYYVSTCTELSKLPATILTRRSPDSVEIGCCRIDLEGRGHSPQLRYDDNITQYFDQPLVVYTDLLFCLPE